MVYTSPTIKDQRLFPPISGQLHWRHYNMAVAMVSLLPRIDYPLPGKATSSITQKVSMVSWGTIILILFCSSFKNDCFSCIWDQRPNWIEFRWISSNLIQNPFQPVSLLFSSKICCTTTSTFAKGPYIWWDFFRFVFGFLLDRFGVGIILKISISSRVVSRHSHVKEKFNFPFFFL